MPDKKLVKTVLDATTLTCLAADMEKKLLKKTSPLTPATMQ